MSKVVVDTYSVCCTRIESLIEKTVSICEKGMFFSLNLLIVFFSFSSQPLLPNCLYLIYSFLVMYLYGRKVKGKEQIPTENPKSNHEIMLPFPVTSEAIYDGTLYDCPIPASQIDTVSKHTHTHHT